MGLINIGSNSGPQ
jgi:hypothetical protein